MDKKKIRVLYCGNHAGIFLSHRLPVFKEMNRRGVDVHVAVPVKPDRLSKNIDQNAISTIRSHGFKVHNIPIHRSSVSIKAELYTVWRILRLYRSLKPDLIYHATQKPIFYGSFLSILLKVPCVINTLTGLGFVFTDTGLKAKIIKKIMTTIYRFSLNKQNTANIFHNHDDRKAFVAKGLVSEKNSYVIKGSGVDLDEFVTTQEPEGDTVNIIFPARLLKDKGIYEFVGAAKKLKGKYSQARFILVGDTDALNPSSVKQSDVVQWEKQGIVEWWGWRKNMPKVYQTAHIVCLPSYREGMSKSLIEGLASGRPVVTTDVPGCREIVENKNGFLVKKEDEQSLADAIESLIKDKNLRQKMGKQSRKLARSEFSIEKVVTETMKICQRLLRSKKLDEKMIFP